MCTATVCAVVLSWLAHALLVLLQRVPVSMEATSAVVVVFVNLGMEDLTVRSLSGKVSSNMSMCAVCSASAFSEVFKSDLIRHTHMSYIYHGMRDGSGEWGVGVYNNWEASGRLAVFADTACTCAASYVMYQHNSRRHCVYIVCMEHCLLSSVVCAWVCECTCWVSVIVFSAAAAECGCNNRGNCFTTVEVDGSWMHRCNCSSPYYGDRCQYEYGKRK